jgi:hypothetical protein
VSREWRRSNERPSIKIEAIIGVAIDQSPKVLCAAGCTVASRKVGVTVDVRQRERKIETNENAALA